MLKSRWRIAAGNTLIGGYRACGRVVGCRGSATNGRLPEAWHHPFGEELHRAADLGLRLAAAVEPADNPVDPRVGAVLLDLVADLLRCPEDRRAVVQVVVVGLRVTA